MKPSALDLIKHGRERLRRRGKIFGRSKSVSRVSGYDRSGARRADQLCRAKDYCFTPEVNDWSAKYCSVAPNRLIAFGGVLPGTVPDPGAEVDRLAKLGIRALKLHPSHQVLSPNDYMVGNRGLAAVYERAQVNGMPIMIHTGTSIFPVRAIYTHNRCFVTMCASTIRILW